MAFQQFLSQARKHWTTYLPAKVAALKAAGELEPALRAAAQAAQERLLELMALGYQAHEAEAVARAEHLLLPPEAGADVENWEREELAKLEANFRAKVADESDAITDEIAQRTEPAPQASTDPTQPGTAGCLTVRIPGSSETMRFILMSAEGFQRMKPYAVSPTPLDPGSDSSDPVTF